MELLKHNIDYVIIGILGVMSFFVLWYTIERIIFYSRVNINGYANIETLEEALTKNLTTLYNHLLKCPIYRTSWHSCWHNDHILRHGYGWWHRYKKYHDRSIFGVKSDRIWPTCGDPNAHDLQRLC